MSYQPDKHQTNLDTMVRHMEVEVGSRPFGSGSTEHLLLQAAAHYEVAVGFFAGFL